MLSVAHRPWSEPPRRPRMSNDEDVRPGVALTSRHLIDRLNKELLGNVSIKLSM